jgi:pyruvate dehydrogenase E1 component alpha subunit
VRREAQLAAIEAAVNREVAEAQEYALASAWPEVSELETDVLGPTVKPPAITVYAGAA